MGTIKDKNSKDVTEAEEIQKRWKEYTEELYKKDLNDPDNHMVWPLTQSQTFWEQSQVALRKPCCQYS